MNIYTYSDYVICKTNDDNKILYYMWSIDDLYRDFEIY